MVRSELEFDSRSCSFSYYICGSQPGAIFNPTPSPGDIWPYLEKNFDWLGKEYSTGKWWGEARNVAEHPIMLRTAPTTKNYLASNVSTAEDKKPYLIPEHLQWYYFPSPIQFISVEAKMQPKVRVLVIYLYFINTYFVRLTVKWK